MAHVLEKVVATPEYIRPVAPLFGLLFATSQTRFTGTS